MTLALRRGGPSNPASARPPGAVDPPAAPITSWTLMRAPGRRCAHACLRGAGVHRCYLMFTEPTLGPGDRSLSSRDYRTNRGAPSGRKPLQGLSANTLRRIA